MYASLTFNLYCNLQITLLCRIENIIYLKNTNEYNSYINTKVNMMSKADVFSVYSGCTMQSLSIVIIARNI